MNGKERRLAAGRELSERRSLVVWATEAAKVVAIQDSHDGVPDAVIARDLGVSRTTVRQWLGK